MRTDGRAADEIRPVAIQRDFTCYADGSVLMEMGNTRVICTAMVEDRVPRHCLDKQTGWVSAEYCMLPSANPQRRSLRNYPRGRAQEIQRLIGRVLRSTVDLHQFPGKTIWIDCNVIQADGGTRTASVTGGFVALVDALVELRKREVFETLPLVRGVAALSVGVVDNEVVADLSADEDRAAAVDMNVVMTHDGRFVEIQGTAERQPFDKDQHDLMLELARQGIEKVKRSQQEALGDRLQL